MSKEQAISLSEFAERYHEQIGINAKYAAQLLRPTRWATRVGRNYYVSDIAGAIQYLKNRKRYKQKKDLPVIYLLETRDDDDDYMWHLLGVFTDEDKAQTAASKYAQSCRMTFPVMWERRDDTSTHNEDYLYGYFTIAGGEVHLRIISELTNELICDQEDRRIEEREA